MSKSKDEIIAKLEALQPDQNTGWRERAEWSRDNSGWLRYSRMIAVQMLGQMEKMHLNQTSLAELMGCSQQYVSRILKGKENLTLETIFKIENALGFCIVKQPVRKYDFEDNTTPPVRFVADAGDIEYKKQ